MIIPDGPRVGEYKDNLIGGLAMSVVGPKWARLVLHGLVVVVGFLILSGAVNTAIVGSNGVLNRVAEDGVLPEWFLRPHPKYGTTSRLLNLIFGLQLFTILVSHGDVILLGRGLRLRRGLELRLQGDGDARSSGSSGPALGRSWSRATSRSGSTRSRSGSALIFLVLLAAASVNLFTKQVATISGGVFAVDPVRDPGRLGAVPRRRSRTTRPRRSPGSRSSRSRRPTSSRPRPWSSPRPTGSWSGSGRSGAWRCSGSYLDEVDPEKTDVVVVAADVVPRHASAPMPGISHADQELLTQVVKLAEEVGKPVHPLVVPTDDPFEALARIARSIGAREVVMGASRRLGTDALFDRFARAWRAEGRRHAEPADGPDPGRGPRRPPDRSAVDAGRPATLGRSGPRPSPTGGGDEPDDLPPPSIS